MATRVGGIPALIDDGVEGLLVSPNDSASLARAIDRLLRDPDERRTLGMAARRRQQAEFRLERTVDVLQHLYEALYGASTGRER